MSTLSTRLQPLLVGLLVLALSTSSKSQVIFSDGLETPPPTAEQAARFLIQATFGATPEDIQQVQRLGFRIWIDRQLIMSPSRQLPYLQARAEAGQPVAQRNRIEIFWDNALNAPDQLRQRMAFALSQIFVVSDLHSDLRHEPEGMANYYDILTVNAFGNYRDLLEKVTLSPQMGLYLSMFKNPRPDPVRGIAPDENFARESMQLFSIGLDLLAADGNPILDDQGHPIPTYDLDDIVGYAHVYTGWNWAGARSWDQWYRNHLEPMELWPDYHDTGPKGLIDDVILPAGQSGHKDLADGLDLLANHPNVGPFIGRQLIQRFVTSNPSPAYVDRITQIWNDNGRGERGDLGAVIRAILLDPEARKGRFMNNRSGKVKEPILRMTALWRAFDARADNGVYGYWYPQNDLAQVPLRAPSVFNFFRPDYRHPGEIDDLGLHSPELQIINEATITAIANHFWESIWQGYRGYPGADERDILIDLEDELAMADKPGTLLAHLDLLLMAGDMSWKMRRIILDEIRTIPEDNPLERVLTALQLIMISPEFAVQR